MAIRSGRLRGSAAVVAIVSLVVSACQTGSSPSASAPAASSTAPAASPSESVPSPTAPTGKLVIWDNHYQLPGIGDAMKIIDAEYESQHPGVTIEHVGIPAETSDQTFTAMFAAKAGPDVLQIAPGVPGQKWLADGGVQALNKYIPAGFLDNFSGVADLAKDYDPKSDIFGIPRNIQGFLWYSNTDVFAKAGIAAPPTTWAEFTDDCGKLRAAGFSPIAAGNKDGWMGIVYFTSAWSTVATPQDTLDLMAGTLKFTDPKVRQATQIVLDVIKACADPGYETVPYFLDGVNTFGNGKTGMALGLLSDAADIQTWIKMLGVDRFDIWESPETKYLPLGPVTGIGMTSFTKVPELAWDYIQFASGEEGSTIRWNQAKIIPSLKTVQLTDPPAQVTKVLGLTAKYPSQKEVYSYFTWLRDTYMREFQLLASGDKSMDDFLQALQSAADQAQ